MAIPKVIHYCWMNSSEAYPPKIERCLDSWKRVLPDYEFVLWNFDRFPKEQSDYAREAFEARKFAFCADYLRFYAVYHYGGIYLDCDVEAVKSFNDLLTLPYFISMEDETRKSLEPACFGAEKGTGWVGECLRHFDDRHFVKPDGTFDITPLPVTMQKDILKEKYEIVAIHKPSEILRDDSRIYAFPREFSYSLNLGGKPHRGTYAIHHYTSAWMPRRNRTLNKLFFTPLAKLIYILFGKSVFLRVKRLKNK